LGKHPLEAKSSRTKEPAKSGGKYRGIKWGAADEPRKRRKNRTCHQPGSENALSHKFSPKDGRKEGKAQKPEAAKGKRGKTETRLRNYK